MKPLKMENQKELLQEIRNNNCREILTCEVNIKVGERSKIKASDQELGQIHQFIQQQKLRLEGLFKGVEVIDEKINDL